MSSDKNRQAIYSSVCKRLRAERIKRGFSMTLLAEKTGLSQQAISYVEREMRIPSLDTLLRISHALGIALGDVINKAHNDVPKSAK